MARVLLAFVCLGLASASSLGGEKITYQTESGEFADPDAAHDEEQFDATLRPGLKKFNGLDYIEPSRNWEVAPEPIFEKPKPKARVKMAEKLAAAFTARGHVGDQAVQIGWGCMFFAACYSIYCAYAYGKKGSRMVYFLAAMTCFIATLAYMCLAYPLGVYNMPTREFYYVRYIDWVLTTPIMLYELAVIAGASNDEICWLTGVDIVMIVAGCIGGFIDSDEKYAFWGFGMIAFVPIMYYLLVGFQTRVKATGSAELQHLYSVTSRITALFWACYPLVWWAAEGEGLMSADTEAVVYTILDVVSKAVWAVYICRSSDAISSMQTTETVSLSASSL
eukprot:g516.t1